MKIIKFGGKSLDYPTGFNKVVELIEQKWDKNTTIVVSAIGTTTDLLASLYEDAKQEKSFEKKLAHFKTLPQHQCLPLNAFWATLESSLHRVRESKDPNAKERDLILAQGELIAVQLLTHALQQKNIPAHAVDSRNFLLTDSSFGHAQPIDDHAAQKTKTFFDNLPIGVLPIVTGFIGATANQETTTLGRNGSNYSAALLAQYLDAEEMQNYTHVNGIYTANPDWIHEAKKIEHLHYQDAHELAHFGASILHPKTISPLVKKQIPLRILNTFNPTDSGTLISAAPTHDGISSVTLQEDRALIHFEGYDFLGQVGIDARIFGALSKINCSVGVVSQVSSERGIGLLVPAFQAEEAVAALENEFIEEQKLQQITAITANVNVALLSIIGQSLRTFHKAYSALIENQITPLLFNNTLSGKNISVVVEKQEAKKALQVIHGQIVGMPKKIHLFLFGHGLVGGTLIEQILEVSQNIAQRKNIQLQICAVFNSKKAIFHEKGLGNDWAEQLKKNGKPYSIEQVVQWVHNYGLENCVAIDNTASLEFTNQYPTLVAHGFDLVSSNKMANTRSFEYYKNLRSVLNKHQKNYLYETNVGAGLPLIDTLRLLHDSGDNITKIRGVFSGSLSYLFNRFSSENLPFDELLQQTIAAGYTEPDPREDLSGNDVARKLLVLARELDLANEWEDIQIQNLIPDEFASIPTSDFLQNLHQLTPFFNRCKEELPDGHVLRYIGELSGDLQQNKGELKTQLVAVPVQTPLGNLRGSDSLFEIYTSSYGAQPIVIQGAGAGASVTARGVLGDVLRIAEKK